MTKYPMIPVNAKYELRQHSVSFLYTKVYCVKICGYCSEDLRNHIRLLGNQTTRIYTLRGSGLIWWDDPRRR